MILLKNVKVCVLQVFNFKLRVYFPVIISFLLIVACNNTTDKLNETSNTDLKTILIPKPVLSKDADIIQNLEYIILEEKENSYLGYVSKLRVYKDKIYILDSRYAKSIFIYSLGGKHLKTIGTNIGIGPGEFVSVTNFEIDYVNDQLLVMDNFGYKFMLHDLEGNFLKEIKSDISVTDAVLLPNGCIAHAKSSYSYKVSAQTGKDFCIYITNDKSEILKEGFEYDDNKNLNIHSYGIISSLPNGEFNFAPKFRDTIYNLSYDSIIPKYAINYGNNKKIEKTQIDELLSYQELFDLIKSGKMCFMGDNVESQNHLYLTIGSWVNPTTIFYNKSTQQTVALSYDIHSIDANLYEIMCASNDGYFYGAFNDADLEDIISLFPALESLNLDDPNPILFRYKLKI